MVWPWERPFRVSQFETSHLMCTAIALAKLGLAQA